MLTHSGLWRDDVRCHPGREDLTKAPDQVSWYRPHLETPLALIERAAGDRRSASIIDVGGGESTIVDDLIARGFQNVTAMDATLSGNDAPAC